MRLYTGQKVGDKSVGKGLQRECKQGKKHANFTPLCDAYKFTKHQGMEPLSRGHNLECKLQEEGNSDPL